MSKPICQETLSLGFSRHAIGHTRHEARVFSIRLAYPAKRNGRGCERIAAPSGAYIGWVRANIPEVAKTGRFMGKKYTFVRILCLQRVGTRQIWSKNRLFCLNENTLLAIPFLGNLHIQNETQSSVIGPPKCPKPPKIEIKRERAERRGFEDFLDLRIESGEGGREHSTLNAQRPTRGSRPTLRDPDSQPQRGGMQITPKGFDAIAQGNRSAALGTRASQ
jgi:hypothetical protein